VLLEEFAAELPDVRWLAKVMARRRQDGFWPHLDEAMDLALGLDEPEWLSFVGLARVEAYWLEGRLDAARAELDRVRDVSAGVVVLSRGWIALWTRRLTGIAEPIGLEPFASQIAGDGAHAAELWDRLGYRYEAALALLDTKDKDLLRESLARLSDLGAEAAMHLVRRTMRDLGIRSIPVGARTTTRAHPQGLTRREQEILHLLSEGESNEEIAGSLFISVRTVEHHVSAILGKLGATTRKGAAKRLSNWV
jgi:DNA-binding CsgD family transcriptional regulator